MKLDGFTCDGYEVIRREYLEDIRTEGMVLKHTKSGARVVLFANDDPQKVFNIAFRTAPKNSTGVPHILEHSVLAGSEKYPVKDPFTEMEKGSLRTFMNAFTAPDVTMYPCASCNDKDYKNLVDVYMDSVLHPLIYKRKGIFLQEGWRQELENPEDELTLNGVVYSEMKGSFSNPDSGVYRELTKLLFPDTTYGVCSGGDPKYIPDLSYEEFLEFHRTLYSPANSYIFLYGDLDMKEMLTYLDREYLSAYDVIAVDSEIGVQKPIGARRSEVEYSVAEDAGTEGQTYLAYGIKLYDGPDTKKETAWEVLATMLFSMPGAPIKQALIDAGIGNDVDGYQSTSMRQPFLNVTARETEPDRADEFVRIIRDGIAKIIEEGVNHRSVEGLLNTFEFSYREADFGGYPKGIVFSMSSLDTYLYDEKDPFAHLKRGPVFDELRKGLNEGYFESLLQEALDSDHTALVVMKPKPGRLAEEEKALAEKLAAQKAAMSEEEINALVEQTRALKEEQNRVETEEEKACIPMLSREDINEKQEELVYTKTTTEGGIPVACAADCNSGIVYVNLRFDVTDLPQEDIPYLGLLTDCLSRMDTENYSYRDLQDEINYYTGGFGFGENAIPAKGEIGAFRGLYTADSKVFDNRVGDYLRLLREVLCTTKFDNTVRLREIINEGIARMPSYMESRGNSTAVNYLQSCYSAPAVFVSATKGIEYYRALKDWAEHYEERKDEIVKHLSSIRRFAFSKDRLLIGISAEPKTAEETVRAMRAMDEILGAIPAPDKEIEPLAKLPWNGGYTMRSGNEALTYAGAVQYAAVGGNIRKDGYEFDGSMMVLRTILNNDYLWTKIRILGGAYGVSVGGGTVSGDFTIATYRDPNLRESYDVFNGVPDYVASLALSDKELTRYIIGTIASLDMPLSPPAALNAVLSREYTGLSQDEIQAYRDGVLSVTTEKLQSLAPMLRAVLAQGYRSAVASETKAKECADLFDSLRPIR